MSAEPPTSRSKPSAPKRPAARTATVLGLFGLFIVAVLVILVRRAFPGRVSGALARSLGKRR